MEWFDYTPQAFIHQITVAYHLCTTGKTVCSDRGTTLTGMMEFYSSQLWGSVCKVLFAGDPLAGGGMRVSERERRTYGVFSRREAIHGRLIKSVGSG